MHFLISDRRQRGNDHVKAIEPRPALDVVIPHRAEGNNQHQESADLSQVAQRWHERSAGSDSWPVISKNIYGFGKSLSTDHWPLITSFRHTTIKQNDPPRSAEGRCYKINISACHRRHGAGVDPSARSRCTLLC